MKFPIILPVLVLVILFLTLPIFGQSDSWRNAYSDEEVNLSNSETNLKHGVRFKMKENQLLTNFNRSSSLLKKMFPSFIEYNKTVSDSTKKEIVGYLHFLVGVSKADVNPTILSTTAGGEFGGLSFHLAAGAQIRNYLGVGLGVYGISTLDPWNSHLGFLGTGININGYPGVFFYNATFGVVTKYKLIDDKEYRSKTFEKEEGTPLFFEIKGGVRMSQKFAIGLGYFIAPKIKGNYKEYEVPWSSNVSIFDEVRESKISGFQFSIGFTL